MIIIIYALPCNSLNRGKLESKQLSLVSIYPFALLTVKYLFITASLRAMHNVNGYSMGRQITPTAVSSAKRGVLARYF